MLLLVSNTVVTAGYITEIVLAVLFIFAIIILSVQNKKMNNAGKQSDSVSRADEEPAAESLTENSYAEEETAAAVSSEPLLDEESEEPAAEIHTDDGAENDEPADIEPALAEIVAADAVAEVSPAASYRLAKSFTAKLILSEDILKERYSEIKNALLSYKKVKARTSWKCETYRLGRIVLAKLVIRGKTLRLYLALSPEDIHDEKYKVESAKQKANAVTPMMYKIKNARRVKNAKQLIAILAQKHALTPIERQTENYAPAYMTEEELLAKGLIRKVKSVPFGRQ